jgi:peptidoglycan/xylan/chitin deacetylase (PgdA/CDA1 family)
MAPEQGTIVFSLDAELLWGHLDYMDNRQFSERYPNAMAAYDHVLRSLCAAGVSATWLVVGGMALNESAGRADSRVSGLPDRWTRHIPRGNEVTAPHWYRRAFVRRLANASVPQDVGLHGGLTHLIWTDPGSSRQVVRSELEAGLTALRELGINPRAFSFPRNRECHHGLLVAQGIRCYRGRPPVLSERLGRTVPGSVLRLLDEVGRSTPPPVWPQQKLPGLWNLPASLFLYPIGQSRSRVVGLESRLQRVQKGIDAAARHRGVFHFCLHPVNLAESPHGILLFDSILDRFERARQRGDAAILTMAELAGRMQALTQHAAHRASGAETTAAQVVRAGRY